MAFLNVNLSLMLFSRLNLSEIKSTIPKIIVIQPISSKDLNVSIKLYFKIKNPNPNNGIDAKIIL